MNLLQMWCALPVLICLVEATDYCSSNLCQSGEKHIGCGTVNWSSKCPPDAKLIDIKPFINEILQQHNEKRNQIAGGHLPGFETAKRMATMRWDDELSELAAFNVKQCQMRHDSCRNTDSFKFAGQNLGALAYTGAILRNSDREIIRSRIQDWWNEYKICPVEFIKAYPANYAGRPIGHFTVMAIDKNVAVGCAASRYKRGVFNHFLLACNYASTNIIRSEVYATGKTASGCKTGRNSNYNNLCSTAEVYN